MESNERTYIAKPAKSSILCGSSINISSGIAMMVNIATTKYAVIYTTLTTMALMIGEMHFAENTTRILHEG